MQRFVQGLVKTQAGKIWVWDVVNEVMAAVDQLMDADALRTDFEEYQAMGFVYIEKALQWAANAGPQAILILNSRGCATIYPTSDRLF